MRILLVDDETELTTPLSRLLAKEGYQIDIADNGDAGLNLALKNDYNLLILDWMLPNKSGIELCQELRRKNITTPVLFLTAKDTLDDRVLGLDAGADDYLIKPFELRELLARVRALLRRSSAININQKNRLKIADLELDIDNQLAYRNDRLISLSDKEFQLLQFLMNNPEKLLTHEEIYQHLWPDQDQPSSNVLAALMRLLRRKIEADGETCLIHTVYGKGYRFS